MNHSTVSLLKCADYSDRLQEHVIRLFEPLGGIQSFVKPGQSVLLKPNLLTDRTPEQAVTTHPEVARAVIRVLKDLGAKPSVADSPASVVKLERVWERTGFTAMCREEDVPLVRLEKAGSVPFEVDGHAFSIAKPVLDADVVISLPKVKTHVLTILTAAVKNMYGAVPGYQKTQLHKTHPSAAAFGELMARIYTKAKPHLSIADGIVGMDGDGPAAGRPVRFGFLAASTDALAMDLVLCRILGIRPETVPYLRVLMGNDSARDLWSRINTVGDSPDDLKPVEQTKVPGTFRSRMIPSWLVKLLGPLVWFRPSFSEACVACGRCVKACPADALTLEGRERPLLDARKCIGCCCCHEVCPERAVTMAQSPFLTLVRFGKTP